MVLFAENVIISFVVEEPDLRLQSILTSTPVAKKTLETGFLKENRRDFLSDVFQLPDMK